MQPDPYQSRIQEGNGKTVSPAEVGRRGVESISASRSQEARLFRRCPYSVRARERTNVILFEPWIVGISSWENLTHSGAPVAYCSPHQASNLALPITAAVKISALRTTDSLRKLRGGKLGGKQGWSDAVKSIC
jgi:hypothetical protein